MLITPFHFAGRFHRSGYVIALASTSLGLVLALLPLMTGGAS
jgi:hypothetical protein